MPFSPKVNKQLILCYTAIYFLVFHNTIIKGMERNESGNLVSVFTAASWGLAHCSWREAGWHWMLLGLGTVLGGWMKSQVWKTGSGWAKSWNCVQRRYCFSEEPVTRATCRSGQKDRAWGSRVEIGVQEKWEWDKPLGLGKIRAVPVGGDKQNQSDMKKWRVCFFFSQLECNPLLILD